MTIPERRDKSALWNALTKLRYNRAANQEERDAVVMPFLEPLERELTEEGYVFVDGSMVAPTEPEPEPVVVAPAPEQRRTFFVPEPRHVEPEPVMVLPDAIATKTVPEPDEPAPHRRSFPKKH